MAKSRTLAAAHSDLDAARTRLVEIEQAESAALQKSDEAYASWLRQKRLAEAELARLEQEVGKAAAEAEAEEARARLAEYDARYKAAAARNREVEKRLREDVPKAWAIIAQFIEDAALAEIETAEVLREMPREYDPKIWIGDPDRSIRCGPPMDEEIVSEELVARWVDPKTGSIFADEPKASRAIKRPFREVNYRPFRPVDEPLPFYRGIRMPRLDAVGDHFLYDGTALRSPHQALAAIRASRNRPRPQARPVLTKLEPIDPPAAAFALPPPLGA